MKRVILPLAASLALFAGTPAVAGPVLTGGIYLPDVETTGMSASPDALAIDLRAPLNSNFWIGGTLATSLSSDSVTPGAEIELGTSLTFNLGVQHEFAHNVAGYAYLGYGSGKVDSSVATGDIDGLGVAYGLGLQFGVGQRMVVDAGYITLFDGDMESAGGTSMDVTVAGPRVSLGYRF